MHSGHAGTKIKSIAHSDNQFFRSALFQQLHYILNSRTIPFASEFITDIFNIFRFHSQGFIRMWIIETFFQQFPQPFRFHFVRYDSIFFGQSFQLLCRKLPLLHIGKDK